MIRRFWRPRRPPCSPEPQREVPEDYVGDQREFAEKLIGMARHHEEATGIYPRVIALDRTSPSLELLTAQELGFLVWQD